MRDELITALEAMPEHDRCAEAMAILRDLLGDSDGGLDYLWRRYRIGGAKARILLLMDRAWPRWLEGGHVADVIGTGRSVISTHICQLRPRAARHGIQIECECGRYRLAKRIDIPDLPIPVRYRKNVGGVWTDDDTADLVRMVQSGSEISAIADEMGRTERACLDRMRVLRRKGVL